MEKPGYLARPIRLPFFRKERFPGIKETIIVPFRKNLEKSRCRGFKSLQGHLGFSPQGVSHRDDLFKAANPSRAIYIIADDICS